MPPLLPPPAPPTEKGTDFDADPIDFPFGVIKLDLWDPCEYRFIA